MKKQTKLGLILAAAAVLSVSVASLVSAKGWVQEGGEWYYLDSNNEKVTDTIQSSGTSKFYLSSEDGRMMKDYFLEDRDGQNYYFGQNGAMVTSTWVAVNSADVSNQGDYIPDNYWYYFQASGKAMKGGSGTIKKTTIDGKKYAFNDVGQMLTGWITEDGKVINPDDQTNPFVDALYYAGGDNDGVLRAGWVTYYDGYDSGEDWQNDKTNLYFYFNTTNNKKISNQTKKINGKTYAFSDEGLMLSKWDAHEGHGYSKPNTYFSGEDDGHQVKKGWVYAVPAQDIDTKAYGDDEEKYMYFGSSGDITKDQIKKINGKYYCFNQKGIMKDGLIIWVTAHNTSSTATNKYANKLDMDYAEGKDVMQRGILQVDSDKLKDFVEVNPYGTVVSQGGDTGVLEDDVITLHYFAADGSRKTGTNKIQFSDDQYDFCSNASGMKGSGNFSKKYYALGMLLKANSDIRYGIYNTSFSNTNKSDGTFAPAFCAQKASWEMNMNFDYYQVLTTAGARQKGNDTAKKDADGNYWYIEKGTNYLRGIWTKNIRNKSDKFETYKVSTTRILGMGNAAMTNLYNASTLDEYNRCASFSTTDLFDMLQAGDESEFAATFNISAMPTFAWNIIGTSFNATATQKVIFKDEISFKTNQNMKGLWFQSDYGDSTNKWIPFGFNDAAGNTCHSIFGDTNASGIKSPYEVIPNNDYFLNCYWAD